MVFFVAFFSLSACLFGQRSEAETALFNGKDLHGWDFFLADSTLDLHDVWWVEDGLLKCAGEPMGYLATTQEYKNFRLVVEWRWAPGKPAGNSGVLLRITGEPKALPRCYEAQLKHGSAGDLYGFHGNTLNGPDDRFMERESVLTGSMTGVSKKADLEDESGDWNRFEIYLLGDLLTVYLNGSKVNEAWGLDVLSGKIGFQSEGEEIHFRRIDLLPLSD